MMQLLMEGGIGAALDDEREADDHNPRGYYEIKDVIKKLEEGTIEVRECAGKALKVISYGLRFLPKDEGIMYKVLYMQRTPEEVFSSMEKMDGKEVDKQEKRSLLDLDHDMLLYAEDRDDMDVLVVSYRDLMKGDEELLSAIREFCGIDATIGSVIDDALYRNREDDDQTLSTDVYSDEEIAKERLHSLGYL
jgi:hypothetical protein